MAEIQGNLADFLTETAPVQESSAPEPQKDPLYEQKKAAFEAKQTAKYFSAKKRAAKALQESASRRAYADKIADMIPFGQPILVGHHSEDRHRRDLDRIHNNYGKSFELQKKAEYYEQKAARIEDPNAISSDDPDAIAKLRQKLAELEAEREKVKKLPIKPRDYSFSDIDMRSVDMANLAQNIKRIKDRIAYLENLSKMQDIDETINGVQIVTDKIDNRVRVYFPGKPSEEVRSALKGSGWKWSPYNGAWQRMISDWAIQQARSIVKKYYGGSDNNEQKQSEGGQN